MWVQFPEKLQFSVLRAFDLAIHQAVSGSWTGRLSHATVTRTRAQVNCGEYAISCDIFCASMRSGGRDAKTQGEVLPWYLQVVRCPTTAEKTHRFFRKLGFGPPEAPPSRQRPAYPFRNLDVGPRDSERAPTSLGRVSDGRGLRLPAPHGRGPTLRDVP